MAPEKIVRLRWLLEMMPEMMETEAIDVETLVHLSVLAEDMARFQGKIPEKRPCVCEVLSAVLRTAGRYVEFCFPRQRKILPSLEDCLIVELNDKVFFRCRLCHRDHMIWEPMKLHEPRKPVRKIRFPGEA